MKVALASAKTINNNIKYNYEQIISLMEIVDKQTDLLCFGEAFLQGFNALTFDHSHDRNIAISIYDEYINNIREKAKTLNIGVGFGFYEIYNDYLYDSYIIIGKDGMVKNVYRRISKGWKDVNKSGLKYREGDKLIPFVYMDKTIVVALCGDIWYDNILTQLNKIKKDFILWPVFISYTKAEWEEKEKKEYLMRVSELKTNVLMVNPITLGEANGGCYHFFEDKIINSLEMNRKDVLYIDV